MLGRSLVSWSSKKQNSVALSTAEAEYIAAGACCAQILYMKQTLLDYGVVLEKVPLLCDNESAVKFANNPVQHCGGMAPKTWAAQSEVAWPTRSKRARRCSACTARHCIVPNRILYL